MASRFMILLFLRVWYWQKVGVQQECHHHGSHVCSCYGSARRRSRRAMCCWKPSSTRIHFKIRTRHTQETRTEPQHLLIRCSLCHNPERRTCFVQIEDIRTLQDSVGTRLRQALSAAMIRTVERRIGEKQSLPEAEYKPNASTR